MGKRREYKIHLTTAPSRTYTDEEVHNSIKKSINLVIDDLILNGHLKIGD